MGRRSRAAALVGTVALVAVLGPGAPASDGDPRSPGGRFVERGRFPAAAAVQGVAVDAAHFYAIGTRSIEKYAREDGAFVARWTAGDDPRVVHLNGGVVVDGVLHCAHSNYPGLPMRSSILRFDPERMAPIGEQPLPGAPGSLTWLDRRGDTWWLFFAHYAGRGGEPGRGPEASRLVAYDEDWSARRELRLPDALVARLAGYSASGGGFGPDGRLWVTGHDAAEIHALEIPARGDRLRWRGTLPAPIAGQGIAWERSGSGRLWGIRRGAREVVRIEYASD